MRAGAAALAREDFTRLHYSRQRATRRAARQTLISQPPARLVAKGVEDDHDIRLLPLQQVLRRVNDGEAVRAEAAASREGGGLLELLEPLRDGAAAHAWAAGEGGFAEEARARGRSPSPVMTWLCFGGVEILAAKGNAHICRWWGATTNTCAVFCRHA